METRISYWFETQDIKTQPKFNHYVCESWRQTIWCQANIQPILRFQMWLTIDHQVTNLPRSIQSSIDNSLLWGMNARGRWNCGSMSDLSSLLSRKDHRRRERRERKRPLSLTWRTIRERKIQMILILFTFYLILLSTWGIERKVRERTRIEEGISNPPPWKETNSGPH
jgi:hypothetical protein